ncbi:hypothetical protein LTR85_002385 [Meristemomyces frigidus]|nr:hypothetical protein LTR85_002385 [Meristemomyces frigidus]
MEHDNYALPAHNHDFKGASNGLVFEEGDDGDAKEATKGGTSADRHDMKRLGKEQELRRDFKAISIFGFSMIVIVLSIGLINGGTAGLIYINLACWISFLAIYEAMAEMGSMAPTWRYRQYRWVSEFAPREFQKILSYIVVAGTAFLSGTYIQGLLVLNYEWYVYERYHGTLFVIAVALFALLFNTFLAKNLALVEGLILVLHIFGFFGIEVPLWVLTPTAPSSQVWTQSVDYGGWGNNGLSSLVGVLAGILPLLGADSAAHMAEELQDASYTLPRTMIRTTLINGALGFVMVITVCYCIGDVDTVLATPTGYGFIQIFYDSTGSLAATNAMVAIVLVLALFSCITMMASASRQLFAFARDKGMPFSPWLGHVRPGWDIPLNAVSFSLVFTSILSLINIGSTVAFNSISSLSTCALLLSYIVSTGCLVWRKMCNKPLLPSRFNLGNTGLAINIFAIGALVILFVFSFFPTFKHPTAETFTWNILIFSVVVVWSVGYYYAYGRHQYEGPVAYVRKLE